MRTPLTEDDLKKRRELYLGVASLLLPPAFDTHVEPGTLGSFTIALHLSSNTAFSRRFRGEDGMVGNSG